MLKPGLTRFILALIVIIYHLSETFYLGKFAVGCFFMLSGYWIALMYEKKYSKKENTLKVFYISRLLRIFPVFYAFSVIGALVVAIVYPDMFISFHSLSLMEKGNVVLANLFIFGSPDQKLRILGPAWSLSVELQFYLIYPFVAFIVRKNKQLLIAATVFFFLVFLWIVYYDSAAFEFSSLTYMFLFLIGVIVYFYQIKFSNHSKIISLILFIAAFAIQFMVPSLKVLCLNGHSTYYTLMSIALILISIPFVISSVYNPTSDRDKYWGEMSFIVYLCHWIWLIPYYKYISSGTSFVTKCSYALIFTVVTSIFSVLVYKFVDRKSEHWRHAWVNNQA